MNFSEYIGLHGSVDNSALGVAPFARPGAFVTLIESSVFIEYVGFVVFLLSFAGSFQSFWIERTSAKARAAAIVATTDTTLTDLDSSDSIFAIITVLDSISDQVIQLHCHDPCHSLDSHGHSLDPFSISCSFDLNRCFLIWLSDRSYAFGSFCSWCFVVEFFYLMSFLLVKTNYLMTHPESQLIDDVWIGQQIAPANHDYSLSCVVSVYLHNPRVASTLNATIALLTTLASHLPLELSKMSINLPDYFDANCKSFALCSFGTGYWYTSFRSDCTSTVLSGLSRCEIEIENWCSSRLFRGVCTDWHCPGYHGLKYHPIANSRRAHQVLGFPGGPWWLNVLIFGLFRASVLTFLFRLGIRLFSTRISAAQFSYPWTFYLFSAMAFSALVVYSISWVISLRRQSDSFAHTCLLGPKNYGFDRIPKLYWLTKHDPISSNDEEATFAPIEETSCNRNSAAVMK